MYEFIKNLPNKINLHSRSERCSEAQSREWAHNIKITKGNPGKADAKTPRLHFHKEYAAFLEEVGGLALEDSSEEASYILYGSKEGINPLILKPPEDQIVQFGDEWYYRFGILFPDMIDFAFKIDVGEQKVGKDVFEIGLNDEQIYSSFNSFCKDLLSEENLGILFFWLRDTHGNALNGKSRVYR